ncbi:MAG TPA: 3-hydroxyacyl-CoA dehydrogenase NAD-binding domain-containing protein [Acidocella sp.]|nr:3-hydroxyacyl-CoA dehydrogenase NAD-binding domain-containing protein [Acidocella sp.]
MGCGLIGESWAALFLSHGYDVVAWDPDPLTRQFFAARIYPYFAQLAQCAPADRARGKLRIYESLADAVAEADFIQENAPEKTALKRELYTQIEACAPPLAIIASSTSALTWSELSAQMHAPGRLITAHPFNPPHLIPLVELYGTESANLVRAEALYRDLGRQPVRLKKDAVGHIANRLASALWREAVNIVAEGIADVSAIDAALVNGPGLRWSVVGAHMAYHLGGGEGGISHYLAHLGPSQERRWETLGHPKLTPEICDMLIAGVNEEAAGRSVKQLEAERDAALIRMLQARRAAKVEI